MKNMILRGLCFCLIFLGLPLAGVFAYENGEENTPVTVVGKEAETMRLHDALVAVTAGLTEEKAPFESLCARAVIARTLFYASASAEENGYRWQTDGIPWREEEECVGLWGAVYTEEISRAVRATENCVLTVNGTCQTVAWCELSSGLTENGLTDEGDPIEGLVSVSCHADTESPDFLSVVTRTADEIRLLLLTYDETLSVGPDPALWFSAPEITEGGAVRSIEAGGRTVDGEYLRKALMLDSVCFEITYDGDFTVVCRGRGSNTGLSLYGADRMAEKGKTWREILAYYFPASTVRSAVTAEDSLIRS